MWINLKKSLFCLFLFLAATSCGRNSSIYRAINGNSTSLLVESQCAAGPLRPMTISSEIIQTFQDLSTKRPNLFFSVAPLYYDYQSPMIINPDILTARLQKIKEQMSDTAYFEAHLTDVAFDLFYLYQNTLRYEGHRCSFPQMARKQSQDLRPFLDLQQFCSEKGGSLNCTNDTLAKLDRSGLNFVEEKSKELCEFFSKSAFCETQAKIYKKKKSSFGPLVASYQERFKKERVDPLFLLRDSHLKFSCENTMEVNSEKSLEVTTMTVKISSIGWDLTRLSSYTKYVSQVWSRKNFKLNIELVDEKGGDIVEIIPVFKNLSYVPDNNNRQIYLSQIIDPSYQMKVLSHEFGHVLGFPDCYIEFFESKSKSLVYYEISKTDTNLMCAIKTNSAVPEDYIAQLREKSCLFH